MKKESRALLLNTQRMCRQAILRSGNGVIDLVFSREGNPTEGQFYFLITNDMLVIDRARERLAHIE
jgi:hypothetical protein